MSSPKALHSTNTPKWGTPAHIVELARTLLGFIHLDPASSEEFNAIVKALMIYTELDNGLAPECEWLGNVFLNPPGGRVSGTRKTYPGMFWDKLIACIKAGTVEKAFWVGFSVEQLCVFADKAEHPLDYSTCILRERLEFIDAEGNPGESPSHGCYVTAINCDPDEFEKLFSPLGKVTHGRYSGKALTGQ